MGARRAQGGSGSSLETYGGAAIVVRSAGIAQLVERNLAKVEVAGSSPVARSGRRCRRGVVRQSTDD